MESLHIVSQYSLLWLVSNMLVLFAEGGTALSGLIGPAPIGIENVMCSGNETSISQCTFVSPPKTPRCLGNFSAGVRCIQGMCECMTMLITETLAPTFRPGAMLYRRRDYHY